MLFFVQGRIFAVKSNLETFEIVLPDVASVYSGTEINYRYSNLCSRK